MRQLVAAVAWNIEAAFASNYVALPIVKIKVRKFASELPSQACTATQSFFAI